MTDDYQDRKTNTAAGSDPAGSDPGPVGIYDAQSEGTQPEIGRVSTFENPGDRPASGPNLGVILIAVLIFALLAFLLLQWVF